MTEHKLSICMGTACYVKGAGELYDYAIENKPDNFEIIQHECDGRCAMAPVAIFDDSVVYGRCTTDIIQELYDEHGTNGSGDITDIDKDEYHKIATIADINNICKGQFYVGTKEANRCPMKSELGFTAKPNTGIIFNNESKYDNNQLVMLNDLKKADSFRFDVYIVNRRGFKTKFYFTINDSDGNRLFKFGTGELSTTNANSNGIQYICKCDLSKVDTSKQNYIYIGIETVETDGNSTYQYMFNDENWSSKITPPKNDPIFTVPIPLQAEYSGQKCVLSNNDTTNYYNFVRFYVT